MKSNEPSSFSGSYKFRPVILQNGFSGEGLEQEVTSSKVILILERHLLRTTESRTAKLNENQSRDLAVREASAVASIC